MSKKTIRNLFIASNFFIMIILSAKIMIGLAGGSSISEIALESIFLFSFMNVIICVFLFVAEKFLNRLYRWAEKRRLSNYSLYEWSGEVLWLDFHERLSSIKEFQPQDLSANYGLIKKEIKSAFNNRDQLQAFKIYLETKCESPRQGNLLVMMQSIIMPLLTASLVALISFSKWSNLKTAMLLTGFAALFILLLYIIDLLNKQMDRNKVLLKLVDACLKEEV